MSVIYRELGQRTYRFLKRTAKVGASMVQIGCIMHCVFEYGVGFVICSGVSMEPTIKDGDVVLTERWSVYLRKLEKGDIVISYSPYNPRQNICKRIRALDGDRVGYRLFTRVPRGHVWLEGDNKPNSLDSREYGPVPQGMIRGKALCKIWPLKDFKLFNGQIPSE